MLLENIKYYNPISQTFIDFEEWMEFGFYLGGFFKNYEGKFKIYISTPSNLLFSYIVSLGIIDADFKNISSNSVKQQYLQLKEGNTVFYNSNGDWKSCSVIGVKAHPIHKHKLTIALLDHKKTTVYVPEDKWDEQIRINSLEEAIIKNAYTVKKMVDLQINENLNLLYPLENMKRIQNRNKTGLYLFLNKKEWIENLDIFSFDLLGNNSNLKDFFYLEVFSQFNNIDFISNSIEGTLHEDVPIMFIGASRALRKMDQYSNFKSLYLVDRHENIERLELLKDKIEQQLITNSLMVKNIDFQRFFSEKGVSIPKGVEIFVWE